jgi:hypothetical protein
MRRLPLRFISYSPDSGVVSLQAKQEQGYHSQVREVARPSVPFIAHICIFRLPRTKITALGRVLVATVAAAQALRCWPSS